MMLEDSVNVETTNMTKLFDDFESLYNLFICLFKDLQERNNLHNLSIKHLNTVCWSSRELCLRVFHKRYKVIIEALKKAEIIASSWLFKEIFTIQVFE